MENIAQNPLLLNLGNIDIHEAIKKTGRIEKVLSVLSRFNRKQIEDKGLKTCAQELSDEDILHDVRNWSFLHNKNKITTVNEGQWVLFQAEFPHEIDCSGYDEDFFSHSFHHHNHHWSLFKPTCAGDYKITFIWNGYKEPQQYLIRCMPINKVNSLSKRQWPKVELNLDDIKNLSDIEDVTIGNGYSAIARVPIKGITHGEGYTSKYDAFLMANLSPDFPEGDRKILVKGIHSSASIDGIWFDLNHENLLSFKRHPLPEWTYSLKIKKSEVQITETLCMTRGENGTIIQHKIKKAPDNMKITVHNRPHICARSFHDIMLANPEHKNYYQNLPELLSHQKTDQHFGFSFDPIIGAWGENFTKLYVCSDKSVYFTAPEWHHCQHPIDQSRGQDHGEDIFTPGYFTCELKKGESSSIIAFAPRKNAGSLEEIYQLSRSQNLNKYFSSEKKRLRAILNQIPDEYQSDEFLQKLALAIDLFIVERDQLKTVIAGFPWFTDWGRDTFIAALGMIKAGRTDEVKDIILKFSHFEEKGTLPNIIQGKKAGNRDTVDAQLWFFEVVKQYLNATQSKDLLSTKAQGKQTVLDILENIVQYYQMGTPNGIKMDTESKLIYAPPHYTWMDTNYPACTPRQGYPVEIQALWYNALEFLSNHSKQKSKEYKALYREVKKNFEELYWNPQGEYLFDNLRALNGESAFDAAKDPAFRSNQSLAISLKLIEKSKAQKAIKKIYNQLVIPAGIRSLSVDSTSIDGFSYCGSYLGAESDSNFHECNPRKFAYHNGTAWSHPLGEFIIAYATAFDFHPEILKEIQQLFQAVDQHLKEGAIGNISEIMDGTWDGISKHYPRGCSSQAWGATELFRAYTHIKYEIEINRQ